jgi:hypothetical protein
MAKTTDRDVRPDTYWDGSGLVQGDENWQRAEAAVSAGVVGEHLPKLQQGEVEIAMISMLSATGDVISIRARKDEAVIRYTVVDEYEEDREGEPGFEFQPQQSLQPLTFGEMTDLLWNLSVSDETSLFESTWLMCPDLDINDDEPDEYFSISSDFYSGLEDWFEQKFLEWKRGRREAS